MRCVTIGSPVPQMAIAPRWPYLPMPSVTRAMMMAMSTTRAPRSFCLRQRLHQLVRDEHQADGDGREGGVQHGQHGHAEDAA